MIVQIYTYFENCTSPQTESYLEIVSNFQYWYSSEAFIQWHTKERYGAITSYTHGALCYFLNEGLRFADGKIIDILSPLMYQLKIQIQDYDDKKQFTFDNFDRILYRYVRDVKEGDLLKY